MMENDWNCPKCGKRMAIHFAGENNHLNWLECDQCGRPPLPECVITTTSGNVDIVFDEQDGGGE